MKKTVTAHEWSDAEARLLLEELNRTYVAARNKRVDAPVELLRREEMLQDRLPAADTPGGGTSVAGS